MLLKRRFSTFCVTMLTALTAAVACYAAAPVNPRESTQTAARRSTTTTTNTENSRRAAVARAVQGRATTGRSRVAVSTTPRSSASRIAVRPIGAIVSRAARTVSNKVSAARAAGLIGKTNVARAGKARATAIFSDVSKIGGGYATCRESYSTCMDQMCANANDTYRRCFCSERFTKFRDTENALDQAMIMLRQFEDNNLNAVDKTAAEVSAMYSATVGEMAIKNDTSAAAQVLESIGDLLSGKTKANAQNTSAALGLMDFSDELGDIWGGENSLFAERGQNDMSTMEGLELFNTAQRQCIELTRTQCENDAVFNMAKSSYNILIAQDCNLYEKTLDKKKQNVEDAVRQAEKYLREARLDEYRSHNSASVNECIAKVRDTMLTDTACGENYKRCLDPTGAFINASTGEPIYTPRLFELEKTISLSGQISGDVLRQNPNFDRFLDSMRNRVTRDLDSCRDDAEYVWTEFKRAALIEIAQAQSEKLEEVRMSCVDIVAECYDTQTNSLNNFDSTTAKNSAALARGTARAMCTEKVTACAALFGNNTACKFDSRGHLTPDSGDCGLTQLLDFVKNVDDTKIAEGCETALNNYLAELCTPTTGQGEYPYNCRFMAADGSSSSGSTATKTGGGANDTIKARLQGFAQTNCKGVDEEDQARINEKVNLVFENLKSDLQFMLHEKCVEDYNGNGYWYDESSRVPNPSYLSAFYRDVFGGMDTSKINIWNGWGVCVENSVKTACEGYNTDTEKVATYNEDLDECVFTDAWYTKRCEMLGGYYEGGSCYVPQQQGN